MTDDSAPPVTHTYLDNPVLRAELKATQKRLINLGSAADPVYVTLMCEILDALYSYGPPEIAEDEADLDPEDPDEEPWKR